jgi:hypothetical protein
MLKSENIERKFIDTLNVDGWEVETDSGWSDIKKIGKTIEYEKWILKTKRHYLECADTHIVFNEDLEEVFVKDLKPNNVILTKDGPDVVVSIENTKLKENM